MVKLAKLIYVFPNLTLCGVENMCAVFVDIYALSVRIKALRVAVATDMIALVNHKALFAFFARFIAKD